MTGSPTSDLTAGICAGAFNVVVGFPFDTIKVRLQAERGVYRTAWRCLVHILRYEGITHGLYRGLSSPLVGGALETGVNYYTFHRSLNWLKDKSVLGDMACVSLAAGLAGAVLSPILGPFELIKCRMQVASGSKFRSSLDCLKFTVRQEGLAGLARGTGATMMREVPGNSVFFTTYEVLRRSLPGRPDQRDKIRNIWEIVADTTSAMLCGGLAGICMWSIVLPIDVAKTRLQTAYPGDKHDIRMSRHLRLLWEEGKLKAMYSGFSPTLARAFPANAAQWLIWEIVIDQLIRLEKR